MRLRVVQHSPVLAEKVEEVFTMKEWKELYKKISNNTSPVSSPTSPSFLTDEFLTDEIEEWLRA